MSQHATILNYWNANKDQPHVVPGYLESIGATVDDFTEATGEPASAIVPEQTPKPKRAAKPAPVETDPLA